MAYEENERHSGDPLQSGDAYKKKNFNKIVLIVFGLAVLLVIGYVLIAHLYFAKPDKTGSQHAANSFYAASPA